ncbi:MAG: hypothetical protein RLZ12_409 [Bacillota bacterium]|jgi:glucose-1-phosphate cytidylyltransferase
MQAVILVGGYGTRIGEETLLKPKPMIEIGEHPILWHIMKLYSYYGVHDFILCLGYKGHIIRDYFLNYQRRSDDLELDVAAGTYKVLTKRAEPWKVTLVDTGTNTLTGGRIRRIEPYLKGDTFCLTYGDGVGNINIKELIAFHEQQQKEATVTAVQAAGRFGSLELEGEGVKLFGEKQETWINGGFFVLTRSIFRLLANDQDIWERRPLETLAEEGQLAAYKHEGFWHPMDTVSDRHTLNNLWKGDAPWAVWQK